MYSMEKKMEVCVGREGGQLSYQQVVCCGVGASRLVEKLSGLEE